MLAAGLAEGGRQGARDALNAFWQSASEAAPRQRGGVAVAITTHVLSPYQFNPFNLNPLRTILSETVDFEALRAAPPVRMLIAATRVADGKLRIFREKELTADVVLASSCLPLLHHAVTIEGETYWDGGYAANPPLLPLIAASRAADVLLVQIMPSAGEEMPTSALEIARRMDQITFNSPLQHELEALAAMKKLSASDPPATRLSKKLHGLTVHHVAAEKEVPSLAQASALNLDWDFLTGLRDAGRVAADRWLERDFARADASVATREAAPDAGETLVGAAPL
jgi:NTE family protein